MSTSGGEHGTLVKWGWVHRQLLSLQTNTTADKKGLFRVPLETRQKQEVGNTTVTPEALSRAWPQEQGWDQHHDRQRQWPPDVPFFGTPGTPEKTWFFSRNKKVHRQAVGNTTATPEALSLAWPQEQVRHQHHDHRTKVQVGKGMVFLTNEKVQRKEVGNTTATPEALSLAWPQE